MLTDIVQPINYQDYEKLRETECKKMSENVKNATIK